MIIHVGRYSRKMFFFLSGFNQTWIWWTGLVKKVPILKFNGNMFSWNRLIPCGYIYRWKERHDKANNQYSQFFAVHIKIFSKCYTRVCVHGCVLCVRVFVVKIVEITPNFRDLVRRPVTLWHFPCVKTWKRNIVICCVFIGIVVSSSWFMLLDHIRPQIKYPIIQNMS